MDSRALRIPAGNVLVISCLIVQNAKSVVICCTLGKIISDIDIIPFFIYEHAYPSRHAELFLISPDAQTESLTKALRRFCWVPEIRFYVSQLIQIIAGPID